MIAFFKAQKVQLRSDRVEEAAALSTAESGKAKQAWSYSNFPYSLKKKERSNFALWTRPHISP
jgi:hypothetical protein